MMKVANSSRFFCINPKDKQLDQEAWIKVRRIERQHDQANKEVLATTFLLPVTGSQTERPSPYELLTSRWLKQT